MTSDQLLRYMEHISVSARATPLNRSTLAHLISRHFPVFRYSGDVRRYVLILIVVRLRRTSEEAHAFMQERKATVGQSVLPNAISPELRGVSCDTVYAVPWTSPCNRGVAEEVALGPFTAKESPHCTFVA